MNKVSIITVVFNNVFNIERTILSVISQKYSNIEYIIVDGGSTDGTLDIIDKYKEDVDIFVSEADNGIYDAMNKGIMLATGEWINFMNSGDLLNSVCTISEIFNSDCQYRDYSVIYGKTLLSLSFAKYIIEPEPLDVLNNRMPFCHQSCFVKRETLLNNLFDLNYKVVADHNLFFQIYKDGKEFLYVPIVVSQYFAEGGFSVQNSLKAYRESSYITNLDKKNLYRLSMLKLKLKDFLFKMLPISWQNKIRMVKYNSNPRFQKYE